MTGDGDVPDGGEGTDESDETASTIRDSDPPDLAETRVRIRGIYTTALTRILLTGDATVVGASRPIRERFDAEFPDRPAAVTVETTDDRQGIGISGEPRGVEAVRAAVGDVGRDAMTWPDPAPAGAVFEGVVDRTRGGGAVVDLPAGAEGYLPFDAVDGYVDVGDRFRVQVRSPEPPWTDDAPLLGTGIRVGNGLVTLRRGEEGVTAAAGGADATELVRSTDLLAESPPEGWGVRWERSALDADLDALGDALAAAREDATALDDQLKGNDDDGTAGNDDDGTAGNDGDGLAGNDDDGTAGNDDDGTAGNDGEGLAGNDGDGGMEAADDGTSRVDSGDDRPLALATPAATAWCWFGRESRFALDEWRRKVTTTMRGHHRVKAGSAAASAAVDLVESVCADPTGEFPIDAVVRQFGPNVGDRVPIKHGKPDGRLYALGEGEVTDFDPDDGQLTVRREMQSRGTYDGLGTDRTPGDVAVTKLKEGRWWYPTAYRGEDGTSKGTYVNVCTPVELFPGGARYVDLHVDVVKRPDGEVLRVDDEELDEAVAAGNVSEELAEKARSVAAAVERALS